MTRRLAALALPLAVAAGCAITEAPDPVNDAAAVPTPDTFVLLDADGDGQIVPAEWEAHGNAVFVALDANADGILRVKEVEAGFAVFDIDGSGALEADEVDASFLDADGDGLITEREYDGHLMLHALESGRDHRLTAVEVQVRRFETFNQLDRNATGRISRLELADDEKRFTLFRL